jgi:hypothetical protein
MVGSTPSGVGVMLRCTVMTADLWLVREKVGSTLSPKAHIDSVVRRIEIGKDTVSGVLDLLERSSAWWADDPTCWSRTDTSHDERVRAYYRIVYKELTKDDVA